MDFPSNFENLFQNYRENKGSAVYTILEELVAQSKSLENRLLVLVSHVEVLQGIITNSVTLHCEANGDVSGEQVTAQCLRLSLTLARNLCAGVQHNQAMICDSAIPGMVIQLIGASDGKTSMLTGFKSVALQLLGNLCVDFRNGQDKVWSLLYPDVLARVLCEESSLVTDTCHMIIHNCTVLNPHRMKVVCADKKMVDVLWNKILRGDSEQEWGLLLLEHVITGGFMEHLYPALMDHCQLHLVLLECALEKLDDCVVPGQLTEQNSYRCICANDVTFLAEKFQCATSTAAKNDLHGLDKNCKTLKLLLQFLNTLSMQSDQLKILQEMPQLLENAIEFLRILCIHDGTANSAKNRTNLRNLAADPVNSNDQLFALKKDLIRIIGNLCYQHRDNQNKIRHLDGIILLLNHFSIDDRNPFIQQWTTWTIRNVCAGNEENQKVIKTLENQGLADNKAVASSLGFELEVSDDGKLRTKR